jgi:hypothetical protein
MDKMEHFREAKLYDGDALLIEHLDGHIGCHQKSPTRKQWHGYFELTADQHIPPGVHYRLVLTDGRTAEINAAEVQNSDVPGSHIHVAEFYVVGELKKAGRSLRDGNRRSLA